MAGLDKQLRNDQVIVKVRPVAANLPKTKTEWNFGGKKWNEGRGGEGSKYKYPADENRKVLMVKYESSALANSEPFLIDVPKHFFDENGEFTASPPYSSDDILYCMWTGGQGISSGWIDLNYQERGGNGGGSTTEEVGCAKWS